MKRINYTIYRKNSNKILESGGFNADDAATPEEVEALVKTKALELLDWEWKAAK